MKFSGREDIDAPHDVVWAQVADFGAFERQAMRRGADVQRIDAGPVVQGSGWKIAFTYRGKERRMKAVMARLDPPNGLQLDTVSSGIDGVTQVELVPLSPTRTRLSMSIELSAKSLTARLVLQSLKLAKGSLSNRFKTRLKDFAQEVEARHRRA